MTAVRGGVGGKEEAWKRSSRLQHLFCLLVMKAHRVVAIISPVLSRGRKTWWEGSAFQSPSHLINCSPGMVIHQITCILSSSVS